MKQSFRIQRILLIKKLTENQIIYCYAIVIQNNANIVKLSLRVQMKYEHFLESYQNAKWKICNYLNTCYFTISTV